MAEKYIKSPSADNAIHPKQIEILTTTATTATPALEIKPFRHINNKLSEAKIIERSNPPKQISSNLILKTHLIKSNR